MRLLFLGHFLVHTKPDALLLQFAIDQLGRNPSLILSPSFIVGAAAWQVEERVHEGLCSQKEHLQTPSLRGGHTSILMVVDRFSKAAQFVPLPKLPSATETGDLKVCHVFRLHFLP